MRPYWTLSLQQNFLHHFSQLLTNGFATQQALQVLKVLFRPTEIQKIEEACALGNSLSQTLNDLQFDQRAIYILTCSEEAGSMLNGLQRASDYVSFSVQNKKELMKKIRYPLNLFLCMLGLITAVFTIFVPQIQNFYQSFNLEGDQLYLTSTLYLIGGFLGFICLIMAFIFLALKCENSTFQFYLKTYLLKTPLLSSLIQRMISYYFSSQWLQFMACGLPLKESLQMMQTFEKIPLLKVMLHDVQYHLEQGCLLEDLFSASVYFTPYFKLVMGHALQIGHIEAELSNYCQYEFNYLSTLLNQTFKVLQFTFLLLIGLLIILIYLSILQPVFDMVQLI